MKKSLAVAIGLGLVAAVLVNIGLWLAKNKKQTEVAAPIELEDEYFEGWHEYEDGFLEFRYPADWQPRKAGLENDVFVVEMVDSQKKFVFSYKVVPNIDKETNQPYGSIKEYLKMEQVNEMEVEGETAARALPRAGSEEADGVWFFSKDKALVVSIELRSVAGKGVEADQRVKIFDQIIETVSRRQ